MVTGHVIAVTLLERNQTAVEEEGGLRTAANITLLGCVPPVCDMRAGKLSRTGG